MPEYFTARTDEHFRAASSLFREYADWLNIDLGFQNFEKELEKLRSMYNDEDGGIILVTENSDYIACVALRRIDASSAELKRMYVRPGFQHKGIGQQLLDQAIELASRLKYSRIKLDTLNHMIPAMKLYKKNGFTEIPAYYHNPIASAVYFEKLLS